MTITGFICLMMVLTSCVYMVVTSLMRPRASTPTSSPLAQPSYPLPPLPDTDLPEWLVPGAELPMWLRPGATGESGSIAPPLRTPHERRRERMRQNGGHHTRSEWLALCAVYGGRCARCKRKRPLTKDHIVPVFFGGTDDISNIQPLCQSCNSSKGTATIDYRRKQ